MSFVYFAKVKSPESKVVIPSFLPANRNPTAFTSASTAAFPNWSHYCHSHKTQNLINMVSFVTPNKIAKTTKRAFIIEYFVKNTKYKNHLFKFKTLDVCVNDFKRKSRLKCYKSKNIKFLNQSHFNSRILLYCGFIYQQLSIASKIMEILAESFKW
jgi:hypothetical protein